MPHFLSDCQSGIIGAKYMEDVTLTDGKSLNVNRNYAFSTQHFVLIIYLGSEDRKITSLLKGMKKVRSHELFGCIYPTAYDSPAR